MERASRRFWNPLNAIFWPGKAKAKGERCTGGFRVLGWKASKCKIRPGKALAKAKAARKGFGPWWNVLRAGFETFYNCALFRPGKALAMGCSKVLRAARDGFVTDVDRKKGMRRQRAWGDKGHEATDIARKMVLADAAHLRWSQAPPRLRQG